MKELGYFVYQIYPKSFKDSNGDGYGDINGIRSKLKYIASLGFDYIWITPMYISPQHDNGYDVSDYYQIDPMFGTESEFDSLIKEAEDLGLGIMMDLVFNHCSTEHQWFKRAIVGDEEYIDYFIWQDVPTNWESKFGGSAWEYVDQLDKYYLHLFDKSQADLNWENPAVRQQLYKIVNYWIERGVRGFRFDVINLISKRYPLEDGLADGRAQYTDGPRTSEFLKELRSNTFANDLNILTVGEMSSTSVEKCLNYANSNRNQLDSVFHFHHLKVDYKNNEKWSTDYWDFPLLRDTLIEWQLAMQSAAVVDTLFWGCHDQPRIASRFNPTNNDDDQIRKNKSLALMMYMMRGISYIYQGEEIGMKNLEFNSIDEVKDIESINYYSLNRQVSVANRLRALSQKSRDNARTPMQWSAAGDFTTSTPWIKYNNDCNDVNVERQLIEQESTLNFYKKLISLKKNSPALIDGEIEFEIDQRLFIYTRVKGDEKYKVIINLWDQTIVYGEQVANITINNGCEINHQISIPPFGSIIFKFK